MGTPVVFLHGLTFDRRTWGAIVAGLGDNVRALTIDLPGHGETGGLPCSLWDAAATVNDTVIGLGIDRPIVVGHSMGAAIAGIYAASFPTLGLVNVDQPLEIRPFARMVRQLWPALSGSNFRAAFEPFEEGIGVDRIPEPLRSEVVKGRDVRQDVVLGYWEDLISTEPNEMQTRIDDASSRITCPYLAVFGRALEPGERHDLLAQIPQAQIEEWPGSGHCVHLVECGRFTGRLQSFIEACAHPAA
ncbi:MAG: alpha/beta fold hydrolase [Candidatus Dormibacteria bacterium]